MHSKINRHLEGLEKPATEAEDSPDAKFFHMMRYEVKNEKQLKKPQ